jgi:hypothetical protein
MQGKRTYLTVAVALGYLAGVKLGFWPADPQIIAALGFSAVAFLRAGLANTQPPSTP